MIQTSAIKILMDDFETNYGDNINALQIKKKKKINVI